MAEPQELEALTSSGTLEKEALAARRRSVDLSPEELDGQRRFCSCCDHSAFDCSCCYCGCGSLRFQGCRMGWFGEHQASFRCVFLPECCYAIGSITLMFTLTAAELVMQWYIGDGWQHCSIVAKADSVNSHCLALDCYPSVMFTPALWEVEKIMLLAYIFGWQLRLSKWYYEVGRGENLMSPYAHRCTKVMTFVQAFGAYLFSFSFWIQPEHHPEAALPHVIAYTLCTLLFWWPHLLMAPYYDTLRMVKFKFGEDRWTKIFTHGNKFIWVEYLWASFMIIVYIPVLMTQYRMAYYVWSYVQTHGKNATHPFERPPGWLAQLFVADRIFLPTLRWAWGVYDEVSIEFIRLSPTDKLKA